MANCENCKNSYVGLDGDLSCNSFFKCVNGSIYQPIDNSKLKYFIDDTTTDNSKQKETDNSKQKEMVNHPKHYQTGRYECLEVASELVKDMKGNEAILFFNAFKYLWRYKLKNGIEDLKKCQFYLKELILINKNSLD